MLPVLQYHVDACLQAPPPRLCTIHMSGFMSTLCISPAVAEIGFMQARTCTLLMRTEVIHPCPFSNGSPQHGLLACSMYLASHGFLQRHGCVHSLG